VSKVEHPNKRGHGKPKVETGDGALLRSRPMTAERLHRNAILVVLAAAGTTFAGLPRVVPALPKIQRSLGAAGSRGAWMLTACVATPTRRTASPVAIA
jgi:hypothetical protein